MSDIINRQIPLEAIQPHPKNYNAHPQAQIRGLQQSHQEFEQYRSVVVWARPDGSYVQVAGHGVVEALRKNGTTEVRADILPEDTDPAKIEAILLADNKHSQQSEPNQGLLQQLLRDQAQSGQNLAALGLGKQEADKLLSQLLAENKTAFLAPVLAPPAWVERDLPERQANQGALASSSGEQWVTMSFTVTMADRKVILEALRTAKAFSNLPTQAQALVRIAEHFLGGFAGGEEDD